MAIKQKILDKLTNNKGISGSEFAELFMDIVNGNGSRPTEFAKVVTGEHRYLQGEAFSLFIFCIEQWAKMHNDGQYDARNQAACELSSIMMKALKEENRW